MTSRWAIVLLLCWTVAPEAITRIVDGDTFDMRVRLWPNLLADERVRVLGVDAAELKEPLGQKAKDFTSQWMFAPGRQLKITVCRRDSFGRVLGKTQDASTGEDLASAIIAAGLGVAR